MRKRRVYSEQDMARVYVALTANDGNITRTSRETGVPEQTIRDWRNSWERNGVPESLKEHIESSADGFVAEAEYVRNLALRDLREQIEAGQVKPRELIIIVGTLDDKITRARGLATQRVEKVISLPKPDDLKELISALTEGVVADSARRHGEIIDAELEEQAEVPALLPGEAGGS